MLRRARTKLATLFLTATFILCHQEYLSSLCPSFRRDLVYRCRASVASVRESVRLIQSLILNVSARWLGFILFFSIHSTVFSLPIFRTFDRLPANCFLGCEKPALTTVKNFSAKARLSRGRRGVIFIIAESIFGAGKKQFFETNEIIFAPA